MKRLMCAAVVGVLLISSALAQAPQGPPKPAPELKRLDYFAGNWTATGTMQPGPMGPGGNFKSSEKCTWQMGGFFLVCPGSFNGGGMNGTETAYFGYDSNKKAYTYHAFNSMGEAEQATGTVNDKTWTWTAENEMGGQKINGKFTVVEDSPTKYTMKFEYSTDGGSTWKTAMEATATKAGGGSAASSKKGGEKAETKK